MVAFVLSILKSPFGLALTGARENERRLQSIGYNVYLIHVQVYALSAFIISVAGALYVFNHQFISLEAVHWRASGEPIMMTLLGGTGTVWGPWVGSALVLLIRNTLSTVTDNGSLILGCLFVAAVMLFRRGVLGESAHWLLHGGGVRSIRHLRSRAPALPKQ
jgi:branched-chain amino acid transport system permease protein